MFQNRNIWGGALALALLSVPGFAQTPPEPPSTFTGNFSAGLALTGGNTDTSNWNFALALVRDPKTRNVIKANGLYLRGDQNDVRTVDRTSANIRDEYTLSGRTFVFGQLDYFRDRFKDITYLLAPTGGIGYKIINNDNTLLLIDGGAGGFWEKNINLPVKSSGSVSTGERFSSKVSSTVTLTQSLASIFKTNDFGDSLTNFAAGVSTSLSKRLEMKVEFLDSYKRKPPTIGIKKNDTAFVTALVLKF